MIALQISREINAGLRATHLHRASLRRRSDGDSERFDAPKPRTVARQALRRTVMPIAQDVATQTHAQVTRALGVAPAEAPVDLSEQTYGFVDSMVAILEDYPIEATKRTAQAFEEWSSLAEEDRDLDGLVTLLDDAFEGAEGGLLNSLRLLYGQTFADMNKAVQVELGVDGYFWETKHDDRVRPAHAAVENIDSDTPYSWDDPPLKASESSNEEDCHPGDDYNCRCIAVPALPSDTQ